MAGSGRLRRWIRPSSTCEPAVSARRASSVSEAWACSALPSVQTPTSTTRSRRSCRYSTSVTSASSVDSPATRRSELRSSRSSSPAEGRRSVRGRIAYWESSVIVGGILPPERSRRRADSGEVGLPYRRQRPAHQSASSSPDATSTAGPCSTVVSVGDGDAQPSAGGRTATSPVVRARGAQRGDDRGDACPVPHERVSPTPRSCTRIATRPSCTGVTNSTFTPWGNRARS